MKLLILAVCVYAAHAATFPAKPWQAQAQASVRASGFAPQVAPPVPVAAVRTSSGSDSDATILKSESDVGVDRFNYAYETGNGIAAEADGSLKKVDNQDVIAFRGSYQYSAPDGTPVRVTYVADENGYQPQSDSLPVAPPVPVAIQRALEYIASHPPHVEAEYKRRV